jgi:hypothetical protein
LHKNNFLKAKFEDINIAMNPITTYNGVKPQINGKTPRRTTGLLLFAFEKAEVLKGRTIINFGVISPYLTVKNEMHVQGTLMIYMSIKIYLCNGAL